MNNYRDIIIRPIITEKSMRYMDEDNKVTLEKVNIMNVKPKKKRVGRYVGKTKAVRKAIVKIKAGQDIDLFGENTEK